MIAPTLVPATKSTGIAASCSAFNTPICTRPRANPPPSASPSFKRRGSAFREGPGAGLVNSRENARTERTILPKLVNPTHLPKFRAHTLCDAVERDNDLSEKAELKSQVSEKSREN